MDPDDPRARRSRAAILDAAVQVIARHGIAAATMDSVAVQAGVARSTLYRHFGDFGQLLFAALEVLAPPPTALDGDPLERLELATLGLARALRDGEWGRVVASILERAQHDPDVARYHARFTRQRREPMLRAVTDATQQGLLVGDVVAEQLTTQLVAPLYYRHLVLHSPMADDEVVAHVHTTMAPLRTVLSPAGA